jgi:hypothetical protein
MRTQPPVKIQPALAQALEGDSDVRALVHFRTKVLRFGQLQASNKPGNARHLQFEQDVLRLLPAPTDGEAPISVVALMANLGVASLEGSPLLLKQLLTRGDVVGGAVLSESQP